MRIRQVKLTPKTVKTLNYLDAMTFPADALYPKEGRHWWIAYDKEGPAGFAGLEKLKEDTAFLCRIGVFTRLAGNGVGRQLIRTMEKYAKKEGYDCLVSHTLPDNYKSANNLIKCGYLLTKPPAWFHYKGALHFCKVL